MINLKKYTKKLVENNGVYFAKKQSQISYPETGNDEYFQLENDSFWFNHRTNCITEAILQYAPKKDFFDIGGGNGFVSTGLESKGFSTVLVEPGIQGCINAKNRGQQTVVCSTLEDASFKKASIPVIGMFDVVEHIENDLGFLQNTYYYLEKNGYVFITVPAHNWLWSNEDILAGHFRRYTLKSITQKLKAVGFAIEYSTYIFSILPLPIFLFRVLLGKLVLLRHFLLIFSNVSVMHCA